MSFDERERRRIAVGWRSASCDQKTFAAKHGIAPRTLRLWAKRYGAGDRPEVKARAIVEEAMKRLEDLLAALDAEAEHRTGRDQGEADGGVPDRQGEPESEVRTIAAPNSTVPKPMPTGFFAGF